jgi:hypothetical protein
MGTFARLMVPWTTAVENRGQNQHPTGTPIVFSSNQLWHWTRRLAQSPPTLR